MMDLRKPDISGRTDSEKIAQIRRYLYQLVDYLQYNTEQEQRSEVVEIGSVSAVVAKNATTTPEETFNSIKALIIKSADIVNAYYEEMSKSFRGEYVAQSEYGTFKEQTESTIKANSKAIEQQYTDLQQIVTDLENVSSTILGVQAYIRTGRLTEDNPPVYGLEIGQTNTENGLQTFNKFARFSADRLSFFDGNGYEVAYLSDYKLHITQAEIAGDVGIGGYTLDTSNGIAFKWTGGST